MSTTQVEDVIEQLPIDQVHPSSNAHRKIFSKMKFEELKSSIKQHGVQSPIWVRKNGAGWEIIAGRRRHRAASELKHPTIPAIVKDAKTAQDALVLEIIENDQREDVNPMDQALAYQDALTKGQHTPETLAEILGKTLPYVQSRLKLLALSKKIREALLAGKIELGHALLLIRIKDPKAQDECYQEIVDNYGGDYNGVMSVSQARSMISEHSLHLAQANFNVKVICMNCPSRSRSQTDLFPDEAKQSDECYDRECFEKNTLASYEARVKRLQDQGVTVLTVAAEVREAKNSPLTMEISPDKGRDWMHPKKYKAMCVECSNRRAFIILDEPHHNEGELCLDKKCFNTMNKIKDRSTSSESAPSRPSRANFSTGAARQHAVFMRDRFLRSRLPAKFEASETLRLRLAIYHILCRFEQFGGQGRTDLKMDHHQVFKEQMKAICPTWKSEKYGSVDDQKLYAAVAAIPEKQLPSVLKQVVLASVPHTCEEVLLQAAPEAGIDLEKDFLVDKTYLETLTKGELISLERAWKLGGKTPLVNGAKMKRPEIVKTLLAQKLNGHIPPIVAKECKILNLGPAPKAKAKKGK